ncbi:uncharacterized protein LOC121638850 [Melanotaenia boesemani]|uniref:uncharacterized protein LOC121638850 n=1 Tax=Melanotaenia boesemani TaxID=1250792 RepID=UPI001C04678A|nr:uncharacterized protein LOC121638850 [Melanotaenia boesemani]
MDFPQDAPRPDMHLSIIKNGTHLESKYSNNYWLSCPLCPKFHTKSEKTIGRHLDNHIKTAVHFEDTVICRCNLPCRHTGHYHCPFCGNTIVKKEDMYLHVTGCQKKHEAVSSVENDPFPLFLFIPTSSPDTLAHSHSELLTLVSACAITSAVRVDHSYTLPPSALPESPAVTPQSCHGGMSPSASPLEAFKSLTFSPKEAASASEQSEMVESLEEAAGGAEQSDMVESLEEAAGGAEQSDMVESLKEAAGGAEQSDMVESLEEAAGGAEQSDMVESLKEAAGGAEQSDMVESLKEAAGGAEQPDMVESLEEAAGGAKQSEMVESLEEAAGGAEQSDMMESLEEAAGGAEQSDMMESLEEAAGGAKQSEMVESLEEAAGGTKRPSSYSIYAKLVKCPHCSLVLYKRNLPVHIKRKHLKPHDNKATPHPKSEGAQNNLCPFSLPRGPGFCVPAGVQSKSQDDQPAKKCESEKLSQFQALPLQNLSHGLCEHAPSLECFSSTANKGPLKHKVLEEMLKLGILKKSMVSICKMRQKTADEAHAPLSLLLEVGDLICLSIHEPKVCPLCCFGRVMVTYNRKDESFYCPFTKASKSCAHKNIARWHLLQTQRELFVTEPRSTEMSMETPHSVCSPTAEKHEIHLFQEKHTS